MSVESVVGLMFSGGSSSLYPLIKVIHGELARPTHFAVFFADTFDEHEWTYEAVARVEEICGANGIQFIRGTASTPLWGDVAAACRGEVDRVEQPPFWTENPGGGRGRYETDEAIRHGMEHVGIDNPCYLSDRLIPIKRLIERGDPQPSLPGLDAPGCDNGACFL